MKIWIIVEKRFEKQNFFHSVPVCEKREWYVLYRVVMCVFTNIKCEHSMYVVNEELSYVWNLSKKGPFYVFTNSVHVYCLILIIHVQALSQTYTLYQQVSNAKHVYPFKRQTLWFIIALPKRQLQKTLELPIKKWSNAQLSCNIIQQHPYPLFLLLCWTYAIKNYMNNVYLMFSFVLNSKSITGMLYNIQEHLICWGFFYQALHVFNVTRQRNTIAF